MMLRLLLFVLLSLTCAQSAREFLQEGRQLPWMGSLDRGPYLGQPEQVHLSYGGNPSSMYVTWLTFDDTGSSQVDWGLMGKPLNSTVKARISEFKGPKGYNITRYIHRASLNGIKPGVQYLYRVGSEFGISAIYTFTGLKERPDGGYRFVVYGDMGNYNARSLGRIQRETQNGDFDMALHVGDMAYDLNVDDGRFGDEFMRQIEPVAAYLPYMVVPGNHEMAENFSQYINRFTMPNTEHNLWYSFDLGHTHFIGFSSEVYFWWDRYGLDPLINQWNWLVEDLRKANANRDNVPWIVTMGHRPMYCSTNDSDDCRRLESIVRTGLPLTHAYGLERLFKGAGVDVGLWAHEHTYERLWPVYDRVVYNGTKAPYIDPPAPVHLLSGSAGCQENTDDFSDPGVWDAFRSSHYGFGRMHIFNATHLHWQQVRAGDGIVEDEIWIVKNKHAPYDEEDARKLKKYGTYVDLNAKKQKRNHPKKQEKEF